ncbi:MAG: alpha/beta hydrolase [Chloroflexota bacterium]
MIGTMPQRRGMLLTMALLAVPALTGTAGLAMLVTELSFRLTNPPGYIHPGPAAILETTSPATASNPAVAFGYAYQDIAFQTAGSAMLRGWLVPGTSDARVGVVTAHGRGADRRDFLRHLPVFHDLGMPTLLFDYREHGGSDGTERGMSMGQREAEDISAAVRYMKETVGVQRVVVIGVSLGASSAILAAAQDQAIDAVVAESPFASIETFLYEDVNRMVAQRPVLHEAFQLRWWPQLVVGFTSWRQGIQRLESPYDVIDRIAPRPILLMHGTGDIAVDVSHTKRLYARAGAPKELWLVDGAEHTKVFDHAPEEYRSRVSDFLRSIAQ